MKKKMLHENCNFEVCVGSVQYILGFLDFLFSLLLLEHNLQDLCGFLNFSYQTTFPKGCVSLISKYLNKNALNL